MVKKIAIVIPVHNEEENIGILLDEIISLGRNDFTIIIVNDNSSDQSDKIVNTFSLRHKNIKLINRKKQEGLHAAIISGLREALKIPDLRGVVTMDGDLSHSPKDIVNILKASPKNDLVVGSRFINGGAVVNWSFKRKIMSAVARHVSRTVLKIETKDCSSGFKYYSKEILSSFNFNNFTSTGYAFQIETVMRAENNSFKIQEVPITFKGRERGKSKVDFNELKKYIASLKRLLKNKLGS